VTTTTGSQPPTRRWLVLLLAALAALAPLLFGAGTASASGLPAAQTRVGVSTLAAPEVVGVHECITAGQHWVRGPSQLRLASGHCVAAEGADATATTLGRDAAESCLGPNSFTADTPVLMADGKEEPITAVKVGDEVLATDPETGHTDVRPVTALIRHGGKHTMVEITLADGSVLKATDHHPIWDATTRTFTDAISLHVGDRVLSDHGQTLTITGEHVYDQNLTAYNLQIDGIHTYYAGTTPVLVHNSCGGDTPVGDVLRGKLGSIHRAPLPPGTSPLSSITDMTLSEVQAEAQTGTTGFKTLWKLLNDNRFNK